MAENLKGAVLVPREILEAAAAQARARFPEYATNPDHGRAANGYQQGFLECYRRERLAAVSLTEREAGEENASKQWVIVSMVEGRGKPYWRPNSAGYTDSFTDAGRYSYSEARQITSGCHGDAVKYCVDDPALYDLIAYENLARGKEIKLWLQNASLLAQLAKAEAGAASPTRKRSSEWVPVGERLPEEAGDYMVFGDCTGSGPMVDIAVFSQYYRDGPMTFHKANQPTHWAPLPTPPQP